MRAQHARPSKSHHGFDLLAAIALVAVNRAFGAGRLFGAKPATFQAQPRVVEQVPAFNAQRAGSPVQMPAIKRNHGVNSSPLSREAGRRKAVVVSRQVIREGGRQLWFEGFCAHAHMITVT